MANEILIVDDEKDIRTHIAGILGDEGYQTRLAWDSDTALAEKDFQAYFHEYRKVFNVQ